MLPAPCQSMLPIIVTTCCLLNITQCYLLITAPSLAVTRQPPGPGDTEEQSLTHLDTLKRECQTADNLSAWDTCMGLIEANINSMSCMQQWSNSSSKGMLQQSA